MLLKILTQTFIIALGVPLVLGFLMVVIAILMAKKLYGFNISKGTIGGIKRGMRMKLRDESVTIVNWNIRHNRLMCTVLKLDGTQLEVSREELVYI